MIGVGIGLPFYRSFGSGVDAQAQAHFNRVIADGGVVPSGLSGVNAFFSAVKAIYGTTDINTAISAAYDAHYLGYKLGAGSGTTLGQAAQKLYSVKSTENLVLQSENFASASWLKTNSTITSNVIAAPDGTMTADLFQTSAAFGFTSQSITRANAGTYTFSCYIKGVAGVASIGSLIYNRGIGFTITSSGVITVNNPVGYSPASNFQITNVGDGWYRISCNFSYAAGSDGILIASSNSGDSFYIWGMQLNTDSVALPYTPTTTTAQTLADVVQTTAASQPLLLAHTGENYWFGSGVAGNFVATASQSALKFNTDFSVVVNIESYIATTNMEIAGSSGGVAAFAIMSTGLLRFDFGGVGYSSTTTLPSNTKWIRFSASGLNLLFYTSNDGTNWTQLGTTVIMSARTTPGNIEIFAGRGSGNIALPLNGKIISIKYYTDSALASLVYNFNPASYNPSVSQTQWSSATGEVWSVSTGTANTGYKAALVTKTIVQGDGVDDRMIVTGLSSRSTFSRYAAINPLNINVFKGIVGANVSDRHYLYATATDVAIYNGVALTYTSEQAQRLALYEADYNGASSVALLNNTTSNTGNAGTGSSTAIEVFAIAAGSNANFILNTLIDRVDAGIDTPTQKTAIYNYLRSINGAAF